MFIINIDAIIFEGRRKVKTSPFAAVSRNFMILKLPIKKSYQ